MSSADRAATPADSAGGLMDRIYRRQRHIYNATRKFYLLGRDHLIASLDPPAGGLVLEIGCGTGRNLIRAARRYPSAIFHGIDVSTEMLATARADIARAGLADRIVLARGDASGFDPETLFGRRRFDRVFFSYSLSMIPDWKRALAEALARVEPDGRLLLVDFGEQEKLPGTFRRFLFAWLRRFHVSPRGDIGEALAILARRHGKAHSLGSLFRGYAVFGAIG